MATPGSSKSRESSAFEPPTYKIFYGSDHTLQWDPPCGTRELGEALSWKYPDVYGIKAKMKVAMSEFLRSKRKTPSGKTGGLSSGVGESGKMTSTLQPAESTKDATVEDPKGVYNKAPTLDEASTSVLLPSEARGGSPRHTESILPSVVAHNPPKPTENQHPAIPESSGDSSAENISELDIKGGSQTDSQTINVDNRAGDKDTSDNQIHFFAWDPSISDFQSTTKKRARSRYDEEVRKKVAQNRGFACEEHHKRKVKCDPAVCPRNGQNSRQGNTAAALRPPSINNEFPEDRFSSQPRQLLNTSLQLSDTDSMLVNPNSTLMQLPAISSPKFEITHPNSSNEGTFPSAPGINAPGPMKSSMRTGPSKPLNYGKFKSKKTCPSRQNSSSNSEDLWPGSREETLRYRTSLSPIPISPLAYELKPLISKPTAADDNYFEGLDVRDDFSTLLGESIASEPPKPRSTVVDSPPKIYPPWAPSSIPNPFSHGSSYHTAFFDVDDHEYCTYGYSPHPTSQLTRDDDSDVHKLVGGISGITIDTESRENS